MLHNSSMKSIKTKVKFLNKETGKITTIQKGFDSFEMADAKAYVEQFYKADHLEVINKEIKVYSIEEKLQIARDKVIKESGKKCSVCRGTMYGEGTPSNIPNATREGRKGLAICGKHKYLEVKTK